MKATVWVAREWVSQDGKIKREKKPDATLKGVKPTDKWCVQFLNPQGKRRMRRIAKRGRDGLADAFQLRADLEAQLRSGTYSESPEPQPVEAPVTAWRQFRERFEREYRGRKGNLRGSSLAVYLEGLDRFEEVCAPESIESVDEAMIDRFRAKLMDTGSLATANKHLRSVRVAMRRARRWKLIREVPEFEALGSPEGEKRPIPDADFERIYNACDHARYPAAHDQPYPPRAWWQALIVVGAFVGLRRNELRSLEWSDVSLDRGLLRIRAGNAKSGKEAWLPIIPVVVEHLRRIQDFDRLVFPFRRYWSGCDRELSQTVLYDEWRRILKGAGFDARRYSFHSLRDTCLNRWGRILSPTQLHAFSRHASFQTTQAHYLDPGTLLEGSLDRVEIPQFLNL